LTITARRRSLRAQKRPELKQDKRIKARVIEARYLEDITTHQIADFIAAQVCTRGLAAKTANHYKYLTPIEEMKPFFS
jgi:hypothetical protein